MKPLDRHPVSAEADGGDLGERYFYEKKSDMAPLSNLISQNIMRDFHSASFHYTCEENV